MPSRRSPLLLSSKLWFFGAVAIFIALLAGTPILRSAYSANESVAKRSMGGAATQGDEAGKKKAYRNIDIRVNGRGELPKVAGNSAAASIKRAQTQAAAIQKGVARLKAIVPGVEAKISPLTGALELLRSSGSLTGPAIGRSGVDIVREFVSENSALYGLSSDEINDLNFLGESKSGGSGMRMVRVEQMVNGLPVFQSETRFILDRDGRIIRSIGLMIPQATATAASPNMNQLLSAPEALSRAMSTLDISTDASHMSLTGTNAEGTKTEVVANSVEIAGNVPSKLVYFPVAPGVLIPAWSQIVFTNGKSDWYILTDANTGTLLWRKNIRNSVSTHDARFRVYVQADGKTPADNPAPLSPTTATPGSGLQPPGILPTIVSMLTVQNLVASPNGWIDDCPGGVCTDAQTQTIGNNVHAYLDRVGGAGAGGANQPDIAASSVIDGNGKPTGNPDTNGRNRDFLGTTPRDFQTNYLPPPQGDNPESGQTPTGNGSNGTLAVDQFRRGMLTQLFYVTNWYHDQLFALGFDEAAGNFQQTNFSAMGLGNDRILAEGQDSSSTDNANFSTPPDGQSGRAQMFRFIGPTVDRDAALDSEILIHELAHGTSNRLIGNASGLIWDPGVGMGEGWSDFYALSLLNNTNADDPNGTYSSGSYATYKAFGITSYTDNYLYGIRRFPYSTNHTVNPLTWADVDDYTNNLSGGIAPDPLGFNIGGAQEVHNTGEVWALTLWEVRSRIIAANAGDVPTGNQIMLQLVTDAMKLTPLNPGYDEARDALIDADCANNACANEQSIWDGFADRGLGYGARLSTVYGFAPVASHQGIVESFSAPYLEVASTTVDDSLGNSNGSIDPGEPIKLTVTLRNPWRSTSKNIASATATLTTATAGVNIVDGNSVYPAIAAQGTAAGDTFIFAVPTSANCGQSLKFTVTPTSTLGSKAVDFALRVGAPSGTAAPVTYTRTPGAPLAIQDNRPRGVIDSQTITDDFEIADINVRVDSLPHTFPGDITFGFKAPNGYGVDVVAFIGGAVAGGGDGDNLTNMVIDNQAVGDILLATNAQAPYTGTWLPIANSPSWPILGFGPQEPVGELNKLNGATTLGTWQVLASDQGAIDSGTLNSWSLIITPRAFACTPFVPQVAVTGTKTASGTFAPGGAVTYTVVLTNSGSGAQADNAGNEFTDTLPAGLTLVSASATSGAASTTGNTANWNGALQLGGGTVTITINATVNANTCGLSPANQGNISFDANSDNTNESAAVTDDPGTATPNDPTVITIPPCGTLQFSSSTYSFTEGNGISAFITVTRAVSSNGAASVTLNTSGGTATAGQDYTPATNLVVNFADGEASRVIGINVTNDALDEADETVNLALTNATGALLGSPNLAVLTIVDNDAAPALSISDALVAEGDVGTPNTAVFTVSLSPVSGQPVTVNVATANGTATAPGDYQSVNITPLTFNPGETSKPVNVPIVGDTFGEFDETFFVNLSGATNATIFDPQGQGTINDEEPAVTVQFGSSSSVVVEESRAVNVTVTRGGDTSGAVSVDYTTVNGTASDRTDYTTAVGRLTFPAGETGATITVLTNEDSYVEGTESFTLSLSNPQGTDTALVSQSTTTVTIIDDFSEPSTNAIDNSDLFVRQHYHDFLNREGDPGGIAFWRNGIESCGIDLGCRAVKRDDSSAAFFLSIEFQGTGYFVYRTYTAGFGPTRVGGKVPITLQEFLPDTQRVGRGVVVGETGADALLDANKNAYLLEFVQRPAFIVQYPNAMTPAQFVDALNTNTGNSLTTPERDALVVQLTANNTTQGRANVLRAITENAAFKAHEFNRAFVLIQYFGYLRRNPNDAPDVNFSGYDFWLNKLNQFNGDYRAAEMVRAFINSAEYRQRFGTN